MSQQPLTPDLAEDVRRVERAEERAREAAAGETRPVIVSLLVNDADGWPMRKCESVAVMDGGLEGGYESVIVAQGEAEFAWHDTKVGQTKLRVLQWDAMGVSNEPDAWEHVVVSAGAAARLLNALRSAGWDLDVTCTVYSLINAWEKAERIEARDLLEAIG